MKILFPLLLAATALSVPASAQTAEKSGRHASWQLGLTGAPEVTYRFLRASEVSYFNGREIKAERDRTETAGLGFTAGASARCFFPAQVGFSVGLQVSRRLYEASSVLLYLEDQFDPATGITHNVEMSANLRSSYTYIGLPLAFLYRSNANGRLAVTVTAGCSLDLLLAARGHFEPAGGYPGYKGSYRMTNVSVPGLTGFVGAGLEYRAGSRLRLRAEPTFRYGFLPTGNWDGPVKEHLWGAGLELGASWRL